MYGLHLPGISEAPIVSAISRPPKIKSAATEVTALKNATPIVAKQSSNRKENYLTIRVERAFTERKSDSERKRV